MMESKQQNKDGKKQDTITVIDNRTGKKIEVPIMCDQFNHHFIRSTGFFVKIANLVSHFIIIYVSKEFSKIGLTTYDPGYLNTASATSKITYIDGEK